MEHDITRDKMKDLMAKLKKGRGYRHHTGHTSSMMTASKATPTQLPRKGTAKVLILDSRASSQLLHTPTKGSPLPSPHTNDHRMPGAQRKLVFSGEHCSCCHHSSKRKSSRSLAAKRTRSPEEETQPVHRHHHQRLKDKVTHMTLYCVYVKILMKKHDTCYMYMCLAGTQTHFFEF